MSRGVIHNKGFAILGLIFILVILAMAGSYMVKMGATNTAMTNLMLMDIRAQYAAFSAIEIARMQWEKDHLCPEQNIDFNERNTALSGFVVQLHCDALVNAPIDNPHFHALRLVAIAKKGQWGEREYVSKQLSQWFLINQ